MSLSGKLKNNSPLYHPPKVEENEEINLATYKALNKPNKSTTKKATNAGFRRGTHYFHPALLEAINVYAFDNDLDKSQVVREALNQYLGDEYLQKGLDRYNKSR